MMKHDTAEAEQASRRWHLPASGRAGGACQALRIGRPASETAAALPADPFARRPGCAGRAVTG